MMVSVDGYIEGPHGNLDWHNWDEEMSAYMMDVFDTVEEFIYGRKSYELMISYWPQQQGPFAQIMNERKKYVLSNTLKEASWNAEILSGNPAEKIADLKSTSGKDLILFAGADTANYLAEQRLIDEYRLIVNPVILGAGKPLFSSDLFPTELCLLETKPFNCGNVLIRYENKI